MSLQLALLIGVLWAGASLAEEGYPADVAQYIERRELCVHFQQEPWPEGASVGEEERRAFIASQLERNCKGSDEAGRALKNKYRNNQAVMDALGAYAESPEGLQ